VLAAYYSHAGDHARAAALLRDAAASMTDPEEAAAIGYHLAYVLARANDAANVAEIDQLLADLPPGYPSAPARAHTTALRHLSTADGPAALEAASAALNGPVPTPADAAEVRLTIADALETVGRYSDAAGFRSAASQWAPRHQLLQHVPA
jgi:thioredoxin-like negative regulator of GroEL